MLCTQKFRKKYRYVNDVPEDIPNMYLFRLVDLFCAIPNNTIDKGNNPFIEEFCKLHDKYLEVERAFGISVNQQSGINFTIRS